MAKSAPKPLVDAVFVTDFGGIEETSAFRDEADHDYTYVPGFSDLKRAQDLAKAEVVAGKRHAKDIPTLPVNCRWVRAKGSYNKLGSAKTNGYRAATKTDLEGKPAWLTALPPGALISATGEIMSAAGDVMLMVVDAQQAARNSLKVRRRTQAMAEAVGADDDGFMSVGAKMKANPTITAVGGTV